MALVEQETQKRKITNRLNVLSGKEWIKFTKSWFVHIPKARDKKILHPACFPESVASNFIEFFTKPGQVVLDPFLGTGSTLIATKQLGRHGIGVEVYDKYTKMSKKRIKEFTGDGKTIIIKEDSQNLKKIFKNSSLPKVQFCITSPPYWNQLKRSYKRQKKRSDEGLATTYGEHSKDIGLIDNYEDFLKKQKNIFDQVYDVMDDLGYLVIITNNVYYEKRMYPLAFDTVRTLSDKWIPKDEKIWCQDSKPLWPFGIFTNYVGNRHHQYCLIFRKELS